MRRRMELAITLGLGLALGLGIAGVLTGVWDQMARAQPGGSEAKNAEPGAVFSPPGTSNSGVVTPIPGVPPFKGKIGRTTDESTSYWPPLPRAPKNAPNV